MGRKGVSKRKMPKAKNHPESQGAGSASRAVSALGRVSDSPVLLSTGKSDAIASGKGGKKKTADSLQNNKKR